MATSTKDRVAAHRQRQRFKPKLERIAAELREDGHPVPLIYDAQTERLVERIANTIRQLDRQTDEANALIRARVDAMPDGFAKARLLEELERGARIQVKPW